MRGGGRGYVIAKGGDPGRAAATARNIDCNHCTALVE